MTQLRPSIRSGDYPLNQTATTNRTLAGSRLNAAARGSGDQIRSNQIANPNQTGQRKAGIGDL